MSRMTPAQAYPIRPVRVIVPFAPAGPTDVFARLFALKLSEYFGRQFYVENLPGAGGNIGTARAAKATPDGYTVLVVSSSYAVNPALYDKVPYDPIADFDPVTLAVTAPQILAVNPTVGARTMKDLVAFIKADSGKYTSRREGPALPDISSESSSD
jgi:tripartite-type tricarboxylate transporter receptor subunit TctC